MTSVIVTMAHGKIVSVEASGHTGYAESGISESREAYFFYPVLLGIDRAVDWVVARPDVDRTRVRYQGTSQGGGFGFYLTGLNHAFTRAAFYVPAITDTMGYLKGRQSGCRRSSNTIPPHPRSARPPRPSPPTSTGPTSPRASAAPCASPSGSPTRPARPAPSMPPTTRFP